ncbi:MAG: LacI family DNA-binding transcriptional regulator [Chloroflexi bacterium]|nr:LacI family DNA-binding transcriptional regulator [Chloroflexota bacterium]
MSQRKTVTISDVAQAAGVSPGTVSRVLNQRGSDVKISESTRQQVLEAVQRLGYRPNLFASALRTQRTGVIGAIVRDINDPFFGLLTRELQQVARHAGFELLLGHAQDDLDIAERQLAVMTNWFEGVLLIGDMAGDQEIIARLNESDTPYVSIARGINGDGAFVNIDDSTGIRQAMDYLARLGHRRVAFVGTLERVGIHSRFVAYQEYVASHDFVWHPDYVRSCANGREQGNHAALALLRLPEPPTAIVCATDLLAVGAIAGAWSVGWRVPDAVSIIGFDDIEEGASTFPPLTTIRQPVRTMASAALELLTALMNDDDLAMDESHVLIGPTLTVRRSCAPPAS